MTRRVFTVCSDVHQGPVGERASYMTTRWPAAWDRVRPPKLILGDRTEGWHFTKREIFNAGGPWETNVQGNHDPSGMAPGHLIVGDTVFLHGDRWDPWLYKVVGRPMSFLGVRILGLFPAQRDKLIEPIKRILRSGRYGTEAVFIGKAVKFAKRKGCRQVVFGHLHKRFRVRYNGIAVECVGHCTSGRLDFVKITVRGKRVKPV